MVLNEVGETLVLVHFCQSLNSKKIVRDASLTCKCYPLKIGNLERKQKLGTGLALLGRQWCKQKLNTNNFTKYQHEKKPLCDHSGSRQKIKPTKMTKNIPILADVSDYSFSLTLFHPSSS